MAIKGWNTPIYRAAKVYTESSPIPFHMPGHKLGAGIPEDFLGAIEKLDLTEIPGMDNLQLPTGVIKEAQELAAAAFGAEKSFFLVNGSTVGLHVAIAASCKKGQSLIVGRDCHRSVIDGMLLAGVEPYFILPEYSKEYGINTVITVETVQKAMDAVPDAAGVLITRPNYYGVCGDVKAIADLVHSRDKILLVDEAHGAHLAFNPRLPVCALEAGADIAIQSAHKTLPALTQGAYLHVGSKRVDLERIKFYLNIFQTTSPSYIIMAYLDIAREIMQKNGGVLLEDLMNTIEEFSSKAISKGIRLPGRMITDSFEQDGTRVIVNTAGFGLSGYDAEKILREEYRIQVEMSDLYNIVCICTIADNLSTIDSLFSGIHSLAAGIMCKEPLKEITVPHLELKLPVLGIESSELLNSKGTKVPLNSAAGRISRDMILPYPPGIALMCPGEIFSIEVVELLQNILMQGGIVHGVDENGYVNVI